jgi:hypothetical protein
MRANYTGLESKGSFVDVKNRDVTKLKRKAVPPISMIVAIASRFVSPDHDLGPFFDHRYWRKSKNDEIRFSIPKGFEKSQPCTTGKRD